MKIFIAILIPFLIFGAEIHSKIESISDDVATIKIPFTQIGVSGIIVKHFNEEHSTIVGDATVIEFDKENYIAKIKTGTYDGLYQNNLPNGTWKPNVGDEVILAFGYERAMLIVPDEHMYLYITNRVPLEWVSPGEFATYLSYQGHPTPQIEDFQKYCTMSNIGLLYLYSKKTLFTLDCKSFTVLQAKPFPVAEIKDSKVPFFSFVEHIRAAWFGSGSSRMDAYEPYYLKLIVSKNRDNKVLLDYFVTHVMSRHQRKN